jgi:hypothetical protein
MPGKLIIKQGARWVPRVARAGYVARGLVYAVVGTLALMAVLGLGGETTDSTGAMQAIVDQPFGRTILGVVAIGLAIFVAWRGVETFGDPLGHGRSPTGLAIRATYLFSGVVYAFLVWIAASIALGLQRGGDGDEETREWTGVALSLPLGGWLVIAVGVGFVGFGLYELYRAFTANLDDELDMTGLSTAKCRAVHGLGCFGVAACGLVFGLLGVFLIIAGWTHDPDEARGLGGTFDEIAEQPFGPALLGVLALGFIAYGLYDGIRGVLRKIELPEA